MVEDNNTSLLTTLGSAVCWLFTPFGFGTWQAVIGYMCAFAYAASLIVYQLGGLITGAADFGPRTAAALAALAGLVYLLVRRGCRDESCLALRAVPAA